MGLIMMGPPQLASASQDFEDEDLNAYFSLFDDPNEKKDSGDKTQTQGQEPCISCTTKANKNDSFKASRKILSKIRKSSSKTQSSKEPECISCGRVTLNPSKKNGVAGADFWKQYPQISGYSEHPQSQEMIRFVEKHALKYSRGLCYRYVKEALCRGKRSQHCRGGSLVNGYLSGSRVFPFSKHEPSAIETLKSQQFDNLLEKPEFSKIIKSPADAPKGAILIYKGGNKGGHIEIKTGHGTSGNYVSDFRAPDSVLKNELAGLASRRYKLVAVMVKSAEKL